MVSMDAYQCFGSADLYIGPLLSHLRDDGPIGIVVPGLLAAFEGESPEELAPYWEW